MFDTIKSLFEPGGFLSGQQMSAYLGTGGIFVVPIIAVALILWFVVPLRALGLWRGLAPFMTQTVGDKLTAQLVMADAEREMSKYARTVRVLVAVAPLLGLLGTVHGMIAMFSALDQSSAGGMDGGISGGISQALVTTQLGLMVAIPGIIAGRLLDRRHKRLFNELEQYLERGLHETTSINGVTQ